MDPRLCGNCGAQMSGDFCQACGQRRSDKIVISRMLRDGVGRLLDLESGFLRAVTELSLRPGAFVRDYIGGRRKSSINPLKYCFIVTTLYALAINLLDINLDFGGGLDFNPEERQIFHILHGFFPYLIYLVLFPVAALQRWLFRESRFSFSETYVFGLFAIGHATWIPVVMAIGGLMESPWGILVVLLAQPAYLAWVMKGFYTPAKKPPVLRAILVIVTAAICSNVFALIIGNLISWLGLVEPLAGSIA